MAKQYGVQCKLCDEFIKLGDIEESSGNKVTFYAAPLEPIPCPGGSSYDYLATDLIDEAGKPLYPPV
jgi:hypothetical protein